ncbi:hypothetical protein GIB67_012128 [Kingdonia uniflora]|uniref:Beta-glucosidase n=1 Tax=Kingdonia uniflora TaxID=39325 RepID=A0A7J7N954_9MAGN|nr:hypothetical protein GIB67_012128 [Kingdonia uniflora]
MVKPSNSFHQVPLLLLLLLLVVASAREYNNNDIIATTSTISRNDFPPDFVFGAGSSAYQIEGAASEDGRKPSIWDTFTHAEKVVDKSNADIGSDQYHKYKDDVKLMQDMGLDAYRMSISWSRLIPDGRGAVNPKGLNYYNNLINELIAHGIKPHVTLNHFDHPQVLEDEYNGFLSPKIIEDFTAYANVCFKEFGDRVKSWSTLNEPNIQTLLGYDLGILPPERCSYPFGAVNCSKGDSTTEVYVSAHNILLSHASAVNLYRKHYQGRQKGQIGLTLLALWMEPFSDSLRDLAATKRMIEFHLGWILHPLVYGYYPATMRKIVGSRLPYFTDNESEQLRGSFDFIGLNYYQVCYVSDIARSLDDNSRDYILDVSANLEDYPKIRVQKNTKEFLDFSRLKVSPEVPFAPWGLQRLLEYVRVNYKNPPIEITENGYPLPPSTGRNDTKRVEFLQVYIESLLTPIRMGSNIRGYFVWSFMDCFEFRFGYTFLYGLYEVDFNDKDRKRCYIVGSHPSETTSVISSIVNNYILLLCLALALALLFSQSQAKMVKTSNSFHQVPLLLLLLLLVVASAREYNNDDIIATTSTISRNDFPPDFVFGAGSSAYQIEGAASEDGRKPSIWDTFTHAEKVVDKSNADIASDQYHKYKDDVKLMQDMGLDAYRMSLSWSRLIPDGRGAVNPKGLNYYNNLINELIVHGIKPHVTLNHFDHPQVLEDEYNGLLSSKIIEDFTAYADVCFKEFGDRVKSWSTFNEPNIQTVLGNDVGIFPPERCSYPFGVVNCSKGDSTTEVYVSAHNILLSHSSAVNLYRKHYQGKQKGQIGITLLAMWMEPLSDSLRDQAATKRMIDFHLGWFLHPLVYGYYPATMRKIVGSRLPYFKDNESEHLRGSFDFIGLNHYQVFYVSDIARSLDDNSRDYMLDISARIGGPPTISRLKGPPEFSLAPWGLQRLLEYVRVNYKNPAIEITENGFPLPTSTGRDDTKRVEYLQVYIESLLTSIRMGSNIRGYFVWSFMDCFEFLFGYTLEYGLYEVNFNDKDRKRYPKLSAEWYTTFLTKHGKERKSYSY